MLVPVFNERALVAASIRRAARFRDPLVARVEIIAVDDGSTDGSAEILAGLEAEIPALRVLTHPRNRGKGAAIRTALAAATGDLCVIHDADLEYDPADWGRLVRPFAEARADAVFGSRFLASDYRRVLYFRHTLGNRLLTFGSNLATDLNLTDMETGAKMVRTRLLRSIPLRSEGFGIEPELTAKLAKRGAVIFEVPIRYAGRTYLEGKKIGWHDGARALAEIVRWAVEDDLYLDEERATGILASLARVHNVHHWLAEALLPHVGERVLEIGAGLGSLTQHLSPRARYLATDNNPHHLAYLRDLALGKPGFEVQPLDLCDPAGFAALAGAFDTVLCVNVLEHVDDERLALDHIRAALAPGGCAILVVPQGPALFCSLDRVLQHRRRYTRADLTALLCERGFSVERLDDFNKVGALGWLGNGRVLGRERLSRLQLKALNSAIPLFRPVDAHLPWHGLSLIAVARRPA